MEHIKLNKYLVNIINQYLDQSFETMCKNYIQTNHFKLKSDLTLREILIKCVRSGCIGFNLYTVHYREVIDDLKRMISDEKIENYVKFGCNAFCTIFYITIFKDIHNHLTVPLTRIDCWDIKSKQDV